MRKRIFTYIILAQVIIIIGILSHTNSKMRILGQNTLTLLEQEVGSSPSGKLKYFYEPLANSNHPKADRSMDVKAEYTINNDTLNERYNYSVDKEKSNFRIITLGDSFTFGMYVDTEKNWPERLEDKLNLNLICSNISKFEVINFGVGGYDNDYSLERYRTRGQKYKPDLVLWFQIDLMRFNEELRPRFQELQKQANDSGELKKQIARGEYNVPFKTARDEVLKELGEDFILAQQMNIIWKIKDYYQGPLLLLSFDFLPKKYTNELVKLTKKASNWYFYNDLRNIYNTDGFLPDKHPNQKGHQMMAEDIYEYLVTSKLIPCERS